jgi:hypothetical protein
MGNCLVRQEVSKTLVKDIRGSACHGKCAKRPAKRLHPSPASSGNSKMLFTETVTRFSNTPAF